MRAQQRGSETHIVLPTNANRDLGIYLLFASLVATMPIYYVYARWSGVPPQTWGEVREWYPAYTASAVLLVCGLLCIFGSTKRLVVEPTGVRVYNGVLRGTLFFTWEQPPAIRLQRIENEATAPGRIVWLVKLVSGRYEYTLDVRSNQQFQSRWLAEQLTRAIGCKLLDRADDGSAIEIDAGDLDLPFRARAARYPQLLGVQSARPSACAVTKGMRGGAWTYSWSLGSSGFYIDVLVAGLLGGVLSAIPWSSEHASLLEAARSSGDYRFYYTLVAVLGSFALGLAGYRFHLLLTRERITLRRSLWSLPVGQQSLPTEKVEEVHLTHTVRGPVVQIVADTGLISFRVQDEATASWLAYELRQFLMRPEEARHEANDEDASKQ